MTGEVTLIVINKPVLYIFLSSYQNPHVFPISCFIWLVNIEAKMRNILISYKLFLYTYNWCIKAQSSFEYGDGIVLPFTKLLLYY